ncbi:MULTISPECIES: hypothetical protein [Alphaproteobacteria]|uniref:DUF1795 domain-containing protein n=2 Tax=Alphaproteobacteria TaxID=28211 RepID=A0A512HF42_9HYPH|nr:MULTISPECIES: hypothetical protein [Alphaproteobacteria]GEO83980.1 hypothetical protein RNA01_09120 [Ciceribacter naphthalenivorans]GLR21142.1 hypothetical protein GCM10007920_09280 [Ciceribacter naphthalenivorans]GLT03998.1 hypothetical protein GCM10007926_09280 [Sphingomonas psychrolutea]
MRNVVGEICACLALAVGLILAAALPSAAQEVTFRTYKDNSGFSCSFPSDWDFKQTANGDRVFSGQTGSAREAAIIVQVIDRAQTAEKTAQAQLDGLKAQLLAVRDGRIRTEGAAPIAGQQAPFVIASYSTTDSAGKMRPFNHIQMVVTAPRVFLLMSYSAPEGIFDEYMKVFQNCSATLALGEGTAAVPEPEHAQPATPPPSTPPGPPAKSDGADAGKPAPADGGDTIVWRRNSDRGFWIAVPRIWSSQIDDSEPYSLDMRHPDRVEGVIVWALDLGQNTKAKDFADAWEEKLADKIFFMSERLAKPTEQHPGVGLPKVPVVVRQYQGEISGATVQSIAAYVVYKKRGYTIVGYHFLGDAKGQKRVHDAVMSFRLSAPDN